MSLGYSISFDLVNGISIGGIPKTQRNYKGKSLLEFIDDYVVLDLETTGLDPQFDEIIEIAAVKFVDCEKVSEFTTLIRPDNKINGYIEQLTGITNEMVEDAPKIENVLPQLISI